MKNIVIGSGPAGRLGSLELGKLGEDVTLIEKNHIAGTCLNEGCMVICALTDITKFIEANEKFNSYGFIKSKLDISYEGIVSKINETQEVLRKLNQKENESVGNEIIYGKASVDGDEVEVNGESLNWDKLLIATGARPFIPEIKGSKYGLTSSDILKIDKVPEKLNIIGGGIIAIEVANIYKTLGSEVNIIARSKALKEIDEDVKEYIFKKLLGEVNLIEGVDVVECRRDKVITCDNKELEGVPFFAAGRVPNSEIVEEVVELNPDKTIKVNEMMESSYCDVYAAGDVTGGYQLTPVARMEGVVAARNMAGYANKVSYNAVPQTLSLNTEVSFVKNEKLNDDVNIAIPGLAGPGTFWKILSGDTGYTKISFDGDGIGKINSISPSSTSDVAYLSYLMRINSPLDEFEEFLEIHPSTDANYKIIKNMWL